MVIYYKSNININYKWILLLFFIESFLNYNILINRKIFSRLNKVISLLERNNKDFIYKPETLKKT